MTSIGLDLAPELSAGLRRLRESTAAMLEAVCGARPRAHDVARAFRVHAKLGWQLWNVAYAKDATLAIRSIPTQHGFEAWRRAAEVLAAPADLLARLNEDQRRFEELVEEHAFDRELLELMADASTPEESAETRWRRQLFMGGTYTWGIRAATLLSAVFLHPSASGATFDMIRIQGLLGLLRTRPNVRWPFAQSIVQSPDDAPRTPARAPLAPAGGDHGGAPLLEAFCSQPVPTVHRRLSELGMLEDELAPGPVGRTGQCDVVTGELLREVAPAHETHPGELALFGVGVRTPAELLVSDHFVHRDLFPGAERELCVFSELVSPLTRDDRDRVAVSERIQPLGRGVGRIRFAEAPRYAELVDFALSRAGWRADDFDVFRIRMRYPPIPVSVMVRHGLLAGPA